MTSNTNQDDEHLRLLSILHYVSAGLKALASMAFGIYVLIGLGMIFDFSGGHASGGPGVQPAFIGWFFVALGAVFIMFGLVMAALNVAVARCLAARSNRTFCIVVSALNCLDMPLGTMLAIFTLVVLLKPNVKAAFEG